MIVKTNEKTDVEYCVRPGDRFSLSISNEEHNTTLLLTEEITVKKIISYYAIFRFVEESGVCKGFHICGIFAAKDEVPPELLQAISVADLSLEQLKNFEATCGCTIIR